VGERKPIRFSVQIPNAPDRAAWTNAVRRADDSGFYSISVPDHLGPSLPQLAPLVALAAAAAVTDRLRLTMTVLDNDFRHPVMLAKEIATLDLLSGGRVDLGLGAGWLEEDYTKTGVAPWDPPGVRVSRLIESVSLLRQLLSGEAVDFKGEFYEVHDFRSFPAPIQSPLPLMIGAREKRIVGFAARQAQIINIIGTMGEGGNRLEKFEQQLRWVDEAGGRARDDFVLGVRVYAGAVAEPGQSGRDVAERFAAQAGMPVEAALASPFIIVGDVAMVRDQIIEVAERYGVGYVTVSENLAWPIAEVVGELSR
jgi:probable F420-dependent oxidoreductase